MSSSVPVRKALISVSDKTGLEELCRDLNQRGVELYATRGTAEYLESKLRVKCQRIEALTQFPEMMDGRVKTLHPRIFGGVLARRENAKDMEEAQHFEVPLFDLLVVNLYPFSEHLGESRDHQSAFIDIGGPSLVRAAAKNCRSVVILSDPADYAEFRDEIARNDGATTDGFRYRLAGRAFRRTSRYDAMIADEWAGGAEDGLPDRVELLPREKLRYGENPHQKAGWVAGPRGWKVLQGKELSYNNLLDADAALRITLEFDRPCVAIVKHNNPCGVAAGEGVLTAVFERALAADPKSAFGGVVATNQPIDEATANAMSAVFLELIVAPEFTPGAVDVFSKKRNLRLITWPEPHLNRFEVRSAMGGWLVQEGDAPNKTLELRTVTEEPLPAELIPQLRFAWLVCKHVRSNAIVIAKDAATLGIGAGQMSRVDAVEIALARARATGKLQGAVLASDAFFPFRDNIDLLKGTGIRAIVQPGGSQRDAEVIMACEEHGIGMAFTGTRHFRH